MLLSSKVPITRAKPPSVMMFTVWPRQIERDERGGQGEGNGQPDDERRFDASQEQKDHQPCQSGTQ